MTASRRHAAVTVAVEHVDRNYDSPNLNWLVRLSVIPDSFGISIMAAATRSDAESFASEVAARNGWTLNLATHNDGDSDV